MRRVAFLLRITLFAGTLLLLWDPRQGESQFGGPGSCVATEWGYTACPLGCRSSQFWTSKVLR